MQKTRAVCGLWFLTILLAAPIAYAESVPPAGSQCEKMNGTTVCTFPDRSYWSCTVDLTRCNKLAAQDRSDLLRMMQPSSASRDADSEAGAQTDQTASSATEPSFSSPTESAVSDPVARQALPRQETLQKTSLPSEVAPESLPVRTLAEESVDSEQPTDNRPPPNWYHRGL